MKRVCSLFIIFIVFSLTGCTLGSDKNEQSIQTQPISVVTEKVQQKLVEQGERHVGKIKADKNIHVLPKTTGKIQEIYIQQGDMVIEGQVLMKIDATSANEALMQAEAAYKSALSNLNQAKEKQISSVVQTRAQLEIAQDAFDQAEKKYNEMAEKFTSGPQLDQAKSAYVQAENNLVIAKDSFEMAKSNTNLGALEAGLTQAELSLGQAKRAVNDTLVVAPISGQITSVGINRGEMASPQQSVAQIINQSVSFASINVTESSLKNFKEGESINVYVPSLDRNLIGEITHIASAANEQSLTFTVDIKLDNKDLTLKEGMLVETFLVYSENLEEIVIPTQAVLGTDKDTYVFIIKDGKAYKKGITIKEMATEETIIKSGLFVDDEIVIKGQYNLVNGSEVEIVDEEGETS